MRGVPRGLDMDYPGRVIARGEADGAIVRALQQRLNQLGYATTSPAGVFDTALAAVVKLYQTRNVDALGRPLTVDGEVGPLSWASLFGGTLAREAVSSGAAAGALPGGETLRERALRVAIGEIGVREVPVGSNRGPRVEEYLASTNLGGGHYWCMAFVYWCFRKAAKEAGVANPFPQTAGCLDAWNKTKPIRIAKAAAAANPALVVPGAVFILDYGDGNGHTGFVRSAAGGALTTVEGNTNTDGSNNGIGVFQLNSRNVMKPNLKGFIIVP